MIKLINNAFNYNSSLAIISKNKKYTYKDLLNSSEKIAHNLLNGKTDLKEARVAFIVDPGYEYTCIQWGIWRAGGIAVPLCVKHPFKSIQYVIEDTQTSIVIISL